MRNAVVEIREFLRNMPDPENANPNLHLDKIDLELAIDLFISLKRQVSLQLETYKAMRRQNGVDIDANLP